MNQHNKNLMAIIEAITAPQKDQRKTTADTGLDYAGSKIILPEDPERMSIPDAIETLEHIQHENSMKVSFNQEINAFPPDAYYAFSKAIREVQGYAKQTPIRTFFGEIAPMMEEVEISVTEKAHVPYGQMEIAGISGNLTIHAKRAESGAIIACIHGETSKGDLPKIMRLIERTREIVRTESIYLGKAIRISVNPEGKMADTMKPKFIDTRSVNVEELILNPIEYDQIETSLWTPIRRTKECIQHRIPLKRGILLEGPYGTGKTLTATATAKICEENGWTFIMLDNVRGLKDTLEFARRYEPAVVFAEDIDRAVEVRDERGNDILNTIDGMLSKDSKLITVLTTNYVEKLDRAMLRPGRLDAIVSIRPPEAEAAERLLRSYGRGLIPVNEDISEAAALAAGNIPAFIREIIERAKLGMVKRGEDVVTNDSLVTAARGIKAHMELLAPQDEKVSDEEALGRAMLTLVEKAGKEHFGLSEDIASNVETVIERLG